MSEVKNISCSNNISALTKKRLRNNQNYFLVIDLISLGEKQFYLLLTGNDNIPWEIKSILATMQQVNMYFCWKTYH